MQYKPLKTQFKRKGLSYDLVKREGDKAIFSVKNGKKTYGYEVIIIRRHNGYTLAGNYIEPAETYPSDSEWGVFGWTYTKLTEAEKRLNTINV
jgi:hypothetical protein